MKHSTPGGVRGGHVGYGAKWSKTISSKTAGLAGLDGLQVVDSLDILLPVPPRVMNLIYTIFAAGRITTQCEVRDPVPAHSGPI